MSTLQSEPATHQSDSAPGHVSPAHRGSVRIATTVLVLIAAAILGFLSLNSGSGTVQPKPHRVSALPATVPVVDRSLGVSLRMPKTWHITDQAKVLRLTSPDSRIAIAMSGSAPAGHVAALQAQVETAIRRTYRPTKIVDSVAGRLGSAPAKTIDLVVTKSGVKFGALLVTASSHWATYEAVVLAALPPAQNYLQEAHEVLGAVSYQRPSAVGAASKRG